ncbi:patatin-like phospholipase family protein [Wenyingzhuangia sp. IMCC45574]
MELSVLKNKKVGLALGGGAVLGAAHIGVLKALEERGIKIQYIAGTSIGSLIASLYAFGVPIAKIEEIAVNFTWFDITNISLSKFGLLSNSKMENLISKYIHHKNIQDSKIPLSMIATDICNGDRVVLNRGDISSAIMASSCIPGVFIPVEIGGKMLVDGVIAENVPVTAVKEMGADFIIAVDLNPIHVEKQPTNIVDVLINSLHFGIRHIVESQIKESDIIIEPDLSKYSLSSTKNIKELIAEGYKSANSVLDTLELN